MTHLLTQHTGTPHPIAAWLELRMAQLEPLPPDRVRLVGVVVLDPALSDPDTAARASWIADGVTVRDLVSECREQLDRYDAIAAVTWPEGVAVVTVVIVNP